jgi:hypothetical protein
MFNWKMIDPAGGYKLVGWLAVRVERCRTTCASGRIKTAK